MDELPIPEMSIFEIVRQALARDAKLGNARHDPRVPLRIDTCHVKRETPDGAIGGFVVTVLVDPQLVAPIEAPRAERNWAASTVYVVHLDENGGVGVNPS